jgi:hypothetical protein
MDFLINGRNEKDGIGNNLNFHQSAGNYPPGAPDHSNTPRAIVWSGKPADYSG